ncbi:hypothetical protein JCM11251_005681 [Rhodosporidiobolus azoricus]
MSRPPSDRTAYTSLPASTSSSSLQTISLASPPHQAESKTSGSLFSSLANVWSGLRAQADGFLRGVGASAGGGGVENGRVGEKRERVDDGATHGVSAEKSERRKRRKLERQQQLLAAEDFLFDGVPPLMPPISQASPLPGSRFGYLSPSSHFSSSSPIASRSALHPSSSPEMTRASLRPYADPSYADALMHAASTGEAILPSIAEDEALSPPAGRSSAASERAGLRSLSGRRKLSVQGIPSAPEAKTSAVAARYGHGRTQSYAAGSSAGITLPSPRHVHFAPPTVPSSTSLPNLASIADAAGTSMSPKTPRRSGAFRSSKSPASSSASKKRTTSQSKQVGSILFGDADLGSDVTRVWKEAKDEERRKKEELRMLREGREKETQERRERRIRELEEEVSRLKGELSAQKPPPVSFPKSPRVSAPPPPPPAPPPPPIGRPHPLLLSARQSLKATPPRPSQVISSKLKRRLSTLGGEGSGVDMGAFLEELDGKRGRLRKVGLPVQRKSEEKKESGGGELGEVLQRAFARKFSGTASPSTPHLPTSRSSFNLSSRTGDAKNPDWTSPRASRMGHSQSHPAALASLAAVDEVPPVPPLPAQPIFVPSTSTRAASTYASKLPPRSSSLVSTSTTIYGEAVSNDIPASSAPAPVFATAMVASSSISPSASLDSLAGMTSAPPESLPSQPVAPQTPRAAQEPDEAKEKAASARLSSARRRSGDGSPLPGLEVGRARPVTPGRAKAKRLSLQEQGSGGTKRSRGEEQEDGEDEVLLVDRPSQARAKSSRTPSKAAKATALARAPSSASSPAMNRRTPTRSNDNEEERYEDFEEGILSGVGVKEVNSGRVFGRA